MQQIFLSPPDHGQETLSAVIGVSWKGSNSRKTPEGREGETKPSVPHYYPNLC